MNVIQAMIVVMEMNSRKFRQKDLLRSENSTEKQDSFFLLCWCPEPTNEQKNKK